MLFLLGKQQDWNLFNYLENTVKQILLPLHMLFSISSQLNSFRIHYVCLVYVDQ